MNSSTKLLVVIDTNVFISGVFWGGKPQAVIQAWQKNKLVLLLSPYLLAEISTVLERFSASDKQKETITNMLLSHSLRINPKPKATICRDPKDNFLLDLCEQGKADYLVTGDKDLLELTEHKSTTILKPNIFLKQIS